MATRKDRTFLRQFHTLFNLGAIRGLTDGQLLERFSEGTGEGAELAFAALVERHASLVLRVCRSILGDSHDAQDAFQATFVVLMKRAKALWVRDSIGPWLHQVAFRTASCARSARTRRSRLERYAAIGESYDAPEPGAWEREGVIHAELNRLPEGYRAAIVLCDLQGHSCEEAARKMGRPVGTVKSWRSRGKDRLRGRLAKLGLAPAAVLSASLVKAATPEEVTARAVRSITDAITAGTVPVSAMGLANGVLTAMILGKIRMGLAAVVACLVLASGLGSFARMVAQEPPAKAKSETIPAVAPPARVGDDDEVWPLTLKEAVRIGLTNSKVIRVINPERDDDATKLRIVAKGNRVDGYRFKSEILAHVRSVEQQYWALNLANVEIWAAETAVDLTDQIVKREVAKLAVGTTKPENVKEAQEQLERFKLELVEKTARRIDTERQLRNILDLPPRKGGRIVPATAPRADRIVTDWETCRKVMFDQQPDLLRAKAIVDAELSLGNAADPDLVGRLKDARAQVQQEVEHALARFFLEVDSDFKLYQTATRLKDAAKQRVDAHAALYEEGKITIDRRLDAVNRWMTAVIQEADFKARYNTAIALLGEAQGDLLDREGVTIAAAPRLVDNLVEPADRAVTPAKFTGPKPAKSGAAQASEGSGKTYSFQIKLGSGEKPFEISGSFKVEPTKPPADR